MPDDDWCEQLCPIFCEKSNTYTFSVSPNPMFRVPPGKLPVFGSFNETSACCDRCCC